MRSLLLLAAVTLGSCSQAAHADEPVRMANTPWCMNVTYERGHDTFVARVCLETEKECESMHSLALKWGGMMNASVGSCKSGGM